MACCAIKHCKNYSTKKDTPKKTFHLFPRDTKLANQWADIVRESRNEFWWQPNTWTCICSDHFSVNDKYTTKSGHQRLKTGAVPSEALVLSSENDDKQESKRVENHGSIVKKPTAKQKRSRRVCFSYI
ncbi:unnamed protein product [Arctia plantaginis]|uniref:THAP-type domain-containing protein n=1 Tax=Arctia plantaginis TaxID=874455 RepID=A0A8S1BPT2_ARCPL|nr:unnamed protein product [Arctia plantaginis]